MKEFALWLLAMLGMNSPATAEEIQTKRLFHMVSPNFSAGVDLPKRDALWTQEELFGLIQPTEGKTVAVAIFTLTGEGGEFTTTAIAQTKVNGEFRAWNTVVKGAPTTGTATNVYVTETNGAKATMALNDALYLVATEIPNGAIDEKSSPEDLKRLFGGTMQYLQSLL